MECFDLFFNKKALMGSGIITVYRIVVVSFIALIVLGISSVFYVHYIDVRDAEARILAREIVECLTSSGEEGVLVFDDFRGKELLKECGYEDGGVKRVFSRVILKDSNKGNEIGRLEQGDSGALWVRKIFEKGQVTGELAQKYEPGYFNFREGYDVFVLKDRKKIESKMYVEVLVRNED